MGFRGMFPQAIMDDDLETFKSLVASDWDLNRHVQTVVDGNTYIFTPLQLAVRQGSVEMVSILLSRPVNVNLESDEHPHDLFDRLPLKGDQLLPPKLKLTPVNVAALHGFKEIVDLLCKSGANLFIKDAFNRTPFANACLRGHFETVKLLARYVLLNQVDEIPDLWGQRPAMLTCCSNNGELLSWLLNKGAILDEENFQGMSALAIAITKGHANILKVLLSKSNSLSLGSAYPLQMPHFLATVLGNAVVLKILLSNGCSVNETNERGQTLLHVASSEGQFDIASYLVNAGINVDKMDCECNTALCFAVMGNHVDVVDLLIKSGANVNIPQPPRRPPLTLAIDQCNKQITESLCNGGADISNRDIMERTPLLHAIGEDNPMSSLDGRRMSIQRVTKCNDICAVLISHGCDINVCDTEGNTALHLAVTQGNTLLVCQLLEQDCDACVYNKMGKTALHVAVSKGNVECTEYLLKHGCDVNAKTATGETAIQMLSKIRTVQSHGGLIHCLQINSRKMESLFRLLLSCGAQLPSDHQLTVRRLQEIYHQMMPLSLKDTSRLVIRYSLHNNFHKKVTQLPLPVVLQKFLLFEN